MPTFESVASSVVSSTSSITFSNVNSSNLYDHFLLTFFYQASGTGNTNVHLRLNGDSNTNYNYLRTMASGSASADANQNITQFDLADVDGDKYNSCSVWIMGAKTNRYKNIYSQGASDGTSRTKFIFGQWGSSSAISSLTVFIGDNKTILNGTVALYGIRGS